MNRFNNLFVYAVAAIGMIVMSLLLKGCGGGGGIPAGPDVQNVEYYYYQHPIFEPEGLDWVLCRVNSQGTSDYVNINSTGFNVAVWPLDIGDEYFVSDTVPIKVKTTLNDSVVDTLVGIADLTDPNFLGWFSGYCASANKYLGYTHTQIYDGTKRKQRGLVTTGIAQFPLGNDFTIPSGGYLPTYFDFSGETFEVIFPTSSILLILQAEYNIRKDLEDYHYFNWGPRCELNFPEESETTGMFDIKKVNGDIRANVKSLNSVKIDSEIRLPKDREKMGLLEKLIKSLSYGDLIRSGPVKVECYSGYTPKGMRDGEVDVNNFNVSGVENTPFKIWHTRDIDEIWEAGSWRYAYSFYLPEEINDVNCLAEKYSEFGSTMMIQVEDANRTPTSFHEIRTFPVCQETDANGSWVGWYTNKITATHTQEAEGFYLPQDPNDCLMNSKSLFNVRTDGWLSYLSPIPDGAEFTPTRFARFVVCYLSSPDNDIPYDVDVDRWPAGNPDQNIDMRDFAALANE